MDLTTVIVLVLTAIGFGFLVFFEMNSRGNNAKLKTEAAAKDNATPQTSPAPEVKATRHVRRRAS